MTFTLKELIKKQGLTQRSLSKKIGISESSINGWVSKGIYPSIDNIVKLAIALNVDLKTLFYAMGIDVTGLNDDQGVSIPVDNQKSEAIAEISSRIKSLDTHIKSLNTYISSLTD